MAVARDEELGSERVTDAKPKKGHPGTLKTIIRHLLLIFAEEPPARRRSGHHPGRLLLVAKVTADGRPLAGPVDGDFLHGSFCFSSGRDSVRMRHLAARLAVNP